MHKDVNMKNIYSVLDNFTKLKALRIEMKWGSAETVRSDALFVFFSLFFRSRSQFVCIEHERLKGRWRHRSNEDGRFESTGSCTDSQKHKTSN